jgi:tungstate transport system substrate-binding protein
MRDRIAAPRLRRRAGFVLALVLVLAPTGCSARPATTVSDDKTAALLQVVLASTTSTQDSGLFSVLIPAFEKAFPQYELKVIAVGTGEALKLGENKDADVLLVHSKAAELEFVAAGFGVSRKDVMYNDFLLVGPASDPAGVKGSRGAVAAMLALQEAGSAGKALFVSRGDKSGTNTKELTTPTVAANKWYLSTGQGMGETLKVTAEKGAYTLVDRATYLATKDTLPHVVIVFDRDQGLLNQYGVIVVTGAKNAAGGTAFSDWITGAQGQKVVGEFGVTKYGQQLFIPNAR